jgi:hypothetical protein
MITGTMPNVLRTIHTSSHYSVALHARSIPTMPTLLRRSDGNQDNPAILAVVIVLVVLALIAIAVLYSCAKVSHKKANDKRKAQGKRVGQVRKPGLIPRPDRANHERDIEMGEGRSIAEYRMPTVPPATDVSGRPGGSRAGSRAVSGGGSRAATRFPVHPQSGRSTHTRHTRRPRDPEHLEHHEESQQRSQAGSGRTGGSKKNGQSGKGGAPSATEYFHGK